MHFGISCLLTAFFRKMISSLRSAVFIFSVPLVPVFVLAQRTPKTTEKAGSALLQLPEPSGWYSGDIHVHRNCGDGTSITSTDQLVSMMETNRRTQIILPGGSIRFSGKQLPALSGAGISPTIRKPCAPAI